MQCESEEEKETQERQEQSGDWFDSDTMWSECKRVRWLRRQRDQTSEADKATLWDASLVVHVHMV